MYDDVNLSTSRLYFSLLQHLRIYEDCLLGMQEELNAWHESLQHNMAHFHVCMDKEVARQQVKLVIDFSTSQAKAVGSDIDQLLHRMRSKREEIVTLRDGVCDLATAGFGRRRLTFRTVIQRNFSARSSPSQASQRARNCSEPLRLHLHYRDGSLPAFDFCHGMFHCLFLALTLPSRYMHAWTELTL